MKTRSIVRGLTTLCVALALAVPAAAGNDMDHGKMKGMKMEHGKGGGEMMGKPIHTSEVDGYTFTYRLIDMKKKMEMMKNMKGMDMKGMDHGKMKSHHLMVFLTDADGKPVIDAKVGFKVEGADTTQKMMCMGMKGGFGADVDLPSSGTYTVKAKAVVGGKTLVDTFTYEHD